MKNDLLDDLPVCLELIEKFVRKKIDSLSAQELDHPDYHVMDYIHDACHTLRGKLPKGGARLVRMRDAWEEDS